MPILWFDPRLAIKTESAGLFISSGRGRHPARVIRSHELIFVRSGTLGIREGEQSFTVPAGSALLLFPGVPHAGSADYGKDLSFYWLHFHPARSHSRRARKIAQLTAVARPDHLEDLLRRYLDDQEQRVLLPEQASMLVSLMLLELTRPPTDPNPASRLASQVNVLLRTRFREPLHTAGLAAELNCNPDYLGRVYRQAFGRTLTEVLHDYRLKHAHRLLLHSTQNIDEIARESGFSDTDYFRRIFRRHTGLAPRRFARLHARTHINTE